MGDVDLEVLTRLFQHQILETMVELRRLSRDFAQKLRSWHPSGSGVYRGRPIQSDDRPTLERLAAYILRPSRRQPTAPPLRAGSNRVPDRQSSPPYPGCPGLDRPGHLPYPRPGRTDESLLWPLLQRLARQAAPGLQPGDGPRPLPCVGEGGALRRRAVLPATATQLGALASQGV